MSNVIQISDFVGNYYIANNSRANDTLQLIIDSQENEYLTNLMGIDLRDLFIADLVGGVPTDLDYLSFYNPYEELFCDKMYRSKGLKETLLGLVFYDYISRDNYQHSLTGVIVNANENSTVLDANEVVRFAESRRNGIVESYNMIGRKICELELYSYSDKIDYTFLDVI